MSDARRWASITDLAAFAGLSLRSVQYMRKQEPGLFVSRQAGKGKSRYEEFDVGAFNVALRKREKEMAAAERDANDPIRAAELRQKTADATMSEVRLAQLQRTLVPLAQFREELDYVLKHLRGQLLAEPKTREHAEEILRRLRDRPPPALESSAAA